MLPRERALRAIHFNHPDMMPVECYAAPTGLHEHGERLAELLSRYPTDFGDTTHVTVPHPRPEDLDENGRYHAFSTDAWGVVWEHNIFGAWGHPHRRPLDDWANLPAYRAPATPPMSGPEFEAARAAAARHKETYYLRHGGGMLIETMRSVRRFEDVLMDIQDDTPEINRLADLIVEYDEKLIAHALALDVDGISFGDDWGTQEALMTSLPVWRRFFKPRYERLFAPVRAAGKDIHFHSCGQVTDILPDLAEIGVNSIWPQLLLYDLPTLAGQCRDLGLAIALHIDRSHLMTYGTPEEVRGNVAEVASVFRKPDGGAWWYIEIDNGFPWENVVALFDAIYSHR
ncbi:MAG: Uroporphyrinogen decarboxylase (URO-D) [Candidatus Latescibacteria bacterium ADurb.Bin168]|nr:MAG: Uroporphyrinogen decarboxylase (URO-D) [Candidatus Latescibacteria bacterium ADurb.Bin168]